MAINLVKGQKIDLTKGNAGLTKIAVGLGWDAVQAKGLLGGLFKSNSNIDCDASAIMLGSDDKLLSPKDVIYFGNLQHTTKSVCHMGDNLTGDGDGDDERMFVEFSKVPQEIQKIVFVVNIYDCRNRRQDFGMIKNAFIRILNQANNEELVRFNLTDNYQGSTSLIVGEVYRNGNEWKFNAVGSGTQAESLKDLISTYSR